MKYRWNLKDISERRKYVLDRLKYKGNSEVERQRLIFTLFNYNDMLENSGAIRYTWIQNRLYDITRSEFSLNKSEKARKFLSEMWSRKYDINDEFLAMLIEVTKNVSESPVDDYLDLQDAFLSGDEFVGIVKDFYQWIGTNRVSSSALDILNRKNSINMFEEYPYSNENVAGNCYYDLLFKESFCNIHYKPNIFTSQIIAHEVMHAVVNELTFLNPWEEHKLNLEIVPNFIELVISDFFKASGYDSTPTEIYKRRSKYNRQMIIRSLRVMSMIESELQKKNVTLRTASIEEIRSVLNTYMYDNLFLIYSSVFALGLYKKFKENKEETMDIVEQILTSDIRHSIEPYFDIVGFDLSTMVEISELIKQGVFFESNNLIFSNIR